MKYTQHLSLAASIISDMRLDRPRVASLWALNRETKQGAGEMTHDEMRALAGTYYLSSRYLTLKDFLFHSSPVIVPQCCYKSHIILDTHLLSSNAVISSYQGAPPLPTDISHTSFTFKSSLKKLTMPSLKPQARCVDQDRIDSQPNFIGSENDILRQNHHCHFLSVRAVSAHSTYSI
jgi:hypothetical protein